MAATFNWVIEWMECQPTNNGLSNVVTNCGWRCTATETRDSVEHVASSYGTFAPASVDAENFTAFDALSEVQVLGWLWATQAPEIAESSLQSQLDLMFNPPVIKPALPWVSQ